MSSELYALRLEPTGAAGDFRLLEAFEYEDGAFDEREEDFFEAKLTFSGDIMGADFKLTAEEFDDSGNEFKVYSKVGEIEYAGFTYYLFQKQSEFKDGFEPEFEFESRSEFESDDSEFEFEFEYEGTSGDDDRQGTARAGDSFKGLGRLWKTQSIRGTMAL